MPATRSLVIASPERDSGKSTVALGVIDLLVRQGHRVGVFRAVSSSKNHGTDSDGKDGVLEMLLDHASSDISYDEAIGVTYDVMHADADEALSQIVARFHAIANKCDVLVVLGTDYTDVSAATELAFNAKIAANLGGPVLLVTSAFNMSDDDAKAAAVMALQELRSNHAQPIGVVFNRHSGDAPFDVEALRPEPDLPVWVLPEEPFLNAPTVAQLVDAVKGVKMLGDDELFAREATEVVVGSMGLDHMLEHVKDGSMVITAGDRTEILLGLLAAQGAPSFPTMSGIILTGGYKPAGSVSTLVKDMNPRVPLITSDLDTYTAARAASNARGHILINSTRKIDVAGSLFDKYVNSEDLLGRLDVPAPEVVTPLMFEYQLIERARGDRKRVVLPEGSDDRILRAASTVLARGIADLVILGDEVAIRRRAAELGLDISAAAVISQHDPEYVEKYATEYTRLREKKGMTLERAREVVTGVSYFGTMMVHMGDADGMVSGAAHTTAHTIRPSFEIIKTAPGISSVSSVFLMCLEDRVQVYGDCAVIPDPSAEQLADVAISSAATAEQFGVEPLIAMLSYSTGDSGSGADVDKVRQGAALVHERRPDLKVEGPIQFDAASDATVADLKLPGSEVAGKATVFVFPDLNTGNNTYKAVQRTAGAIAVGPVLQGLNKPVNDLSRGALVQDIVNTVAITAIQAQG
ncbi:MAG: phosphate acetyltransferase [Cellulomonadaceae bacterium]|jgi:phosphate acetyltransferase|nr:phosphate acetyltransferase [Cellulomonadaceae bacterium]